MKIIDPSATIELPMSGADILRHIERCGRICYKSEGRITENSADDFVAASSNAAMRPFWSTLLFP